LKILNRASLYETVDRVNEAFFFGQPIGKKEALATARWILGRRGKGEHYHGGFGLTEYDREHGMFSFAGDRLNCASARRIAS